MPGCDRSRISINAQIENYVLDAAIKGCFDNIDHLKLLKKLNTFPKLYCVIKGGLKAGIMEGDVFTAKKRESTGRGDFFINR